VDRGSAAEAGHRSLLADRERLADPVLGSRREKTPIKLGSPSFPVYGYELKLLRESDAAEAGSDEKAVVAIAPPLPPGCMTTVWGDDERFVKTYFGTFPRQTGVLPLSTGASATRTATTSSSPHRRRDQRRRAPPRQTRAHLALQESATPTTAHSAMFGACDRFFDLAGAEAVPGDVDHVVGAAEDEVVAVRVADAQSKVEYTCLPRNVPK